MTKFRFELGHFRSVAALCCIGMIACDPQESGTADGVGGETPTSVGSAAPGPSSTPAVSAGSAASAPAVAGSTSSSSAAPVPVDGGAALASSDGGGAESGAPWCRAKAIIDKNCVACHDGKGSSGTPMGLTKYEDFLAAAPASSGKKVFEAVSARVHDATRPMPPRGMLKEADLQVLDAWLKAGALAGATGGCQAVTDGSAAQEPVASAWPPPEGCDAIYKITAYGGGGVNTPFQVEPGTETHPQVQWDAPWGDEKVQAIAFRPVTDNKLVLHHWILYANQGNSALTGGAFLTGWAPGDDERQAMPKDVGMEMPTGRGALRLDLHYNSLTATKSENDQSGVEVCVVKGAHLRKNPAAVTMSLAVLGFPLAPANSVNYEATAVCNVSATQPVHIMSASPHAHKYAVRTRFTVKKKDGREIVMLDHPFVFGEQGSYPLDPEVVVETGDKIYTTCVYTNTTSQNINFGPNTADEMCFNFASYYPSGALSCGGAGLLGGLLGQ